MRIAILGAGISGLSTGHYLKQRFPESHLRIFESSNRIGGCIQSIRSGEFIFEESARGIPARGAGTSVLRLAEEVGLKDKISYSPLKKAPRFIYYKGRLRNVPPRWYQVLSPPYLEIALNSLYRNFKPVEPGSKDESVKEFVVRNFGERALEFGFEAFVRGTRGGLSSELSAKLTMPFLVGLEQTHESTLQGLIKQRSARQQLSPGYFTFRGGTSTLVKALGRELFDHIKLGEAVSEVQPYGREFVVRRNGHSEFYDLVISTLPAYKLFTVVSSFEQKLRQALQRIEYTPLAVVSFGFPSRILKEPGYGYLVADQDPDGILGASWNSSVFPGSSAGNSNISVHLGGRDSGVLRLTQEEIIDRAYNCLAKQMKLSEQPEIVHCAVHRRGLPLFKVGFESIREDIKSACPAGFHVLGNFMQGIGVREIIANSEEFVKTLEESIGEFSSLDRPANA